ncbi:MAG: translation initiation factor IF-3 C-terminal domain-containing protein [bacterium]|nr:translation initiation factor IF-3 C-terminal domain-containing protein [bacterium]
MKMGYTIGDNDLRLKIRKAEELLKSGYGVKMVIRLRGRERIYANSAKQKLMSVVEELQEFGRSQYATPKKEAQ